MKRALMALTPLILIGSASTLKAGENQGYVIVKTKSEWITSIGVGPGVCFFNPQSCAPGIILRPDGTGALLDHTMDGFKESHAFTYPKEKFGELAKQVATIKYRNLPCKLLMTDAGGASIFWSTDPGERIVISFSNGCISKEDGPIKALYDAIFGLPEARAAMASRAKN